MKDKDYQAPNLGIKCVCVNVRHTRIDFRYLRNPNIVYSKKSSKENKAGNKDLVLLFAN